MSMNSSAAIDGARAPSAPGRVELVMGKLKEHQVRIGQGLILAGAVGLLFGITLAAIGGEHLHDSNPDISRFANSLDSMGITFSVLGGIAVIAGALLWKQGSNPKPIQLSRKELQMRTALAALAGLTLFGVVLALAGGGVQDSNLIAAGSTFAVIAGSSLITVMYYARRAQQKEAEAERPLNPPRNDEMPTSG